MYSVEEFDKNKTRVMSYVLYKKRTEYEVRNKFCHTIEEDMLDDIIEYIKDAGYINDSEYVKKIFNEYMTLKSMSIRELKNKVYSKGIYVDYIEEYIAQNREALEEYEINSIKKIIDKKKKTMEPQKLMAYLLNRGFEPDLISKIER